MASESYDIGPLGGSAPTPGVTPAPPPQRTLLARSRRAFIEEVENLHVRLLLANALVWFLPNLTFSRLRTAIYRLAGLQIGAHSLILGRLGFTGFSRQRKHLCIGANTIINAHCFVDLNADIQIGDWVSIGHHVTLITAAHDIGPALCRAGPLNPVPIHIESGCWIGACSTILPGVHLGKSTVVAAGSVVSGNVPDNKVVGGSPARALKSLPAEP